MTDPAHILLTREKISVRSVANWVLKLAEQNDAPITNMALNKLIYFVVEKVLVERRRLLTDAKIEAWEHGPVFREIYQQFKVFGDKPICERAKHFDVSTETFVDSPAGVPEDLSAELEAFVKPLLHWSAAKLRAVSHIEDGPWHRIWTYDGYANPGMEITPETIITHTDLR